MQVKLQYHICHPLWMKEEDWKPCPFMFYSKTPIGKLFKIWRLRIWIKSPQQKKDSVK